MIKKKENIIVKILFAVMCVLPILLQIQGFDIDDSGSYMYPAITLFDSTLNVSTEIIFSTIFNFMFYKLIGFMGLFGMHLINSVICILSAVAVYFFINKYTTKITALIGVIFAELLFMNSIHMVSFNSYTSIITTLAGLLLIAGIIKEKKIFIIISGALAGISMFFRFPHIVSILLVMGILYWAIVEKKSSKYFFKQLLYFMIGFILAIGVGICTILILDATTNLNITFFSMSSTEGSYSVIQLFRKYIFDLLNGLNTMYIPIGIIAITLFNILASKIGNKFIRVAIYIIDIGVVVAVTIMLLKNQMHINLITDLLYLISFCLFIAFTSKKFYNPKVALIIMIGTIASVVQFAGSNTGISHARLCMFILIPVVVYGSVLMVKPYMMAQKKRNQFFIIFATSCMCFAFLYQFVFQCSTAFEPPKRSDVVYSLKSTDKTKGLFTNKYRAEYTDKAVEKLKEIDNKFLITSYLKDMLYYFSDKISPTSAVGIYFDSYKYDTLKSDLENIPKDKMPIIFMSDNNTYSKGEHNQLSFNQKTNLLENFIKQHNYSVYYTDDDMTIYVP